MDTSPLPTASGTTTINSPSDLSYSSEVSQTSTRNTSPASTTHGSESPGASSLLDLNLNLNIEQNPSTLLDRRPNMDRNPFQSVNDRRTKLSTDKPHIHQTQQQHQQQQHQQNQQNLQLQTLRSSMQQLNLSSRGLASSNWREQVAADEAAVLPSRASGDFTPFDSPISHHMSSTTTRVRHPQSIFASPRMEQFPQPSGMASYQTPGTFSDMQLDASYAYCYDRGNGQYTRLIPADMLPPLKDVPALQQSCSGMMVLPQPRALPPNGRSSNTEPVALRVSSCRFDVSRTYLSRLTILAQSPPNTPSSPSDNIQVSPRFQSHVSFLGCTGDLLRWMDSTLPPIALP